MKALTLLWTKSIFQTKNKTNMKYAFNHLSLTFKLEPFKLFFYVNLFNISGFLCHFSYKINTYRHKLIDLKRNIYTQYQCKKCYILTWWFSSEELDMKLSLVEPPRFFHIRLLLPDKFCNLILDTTWSLLSLLVLDTLCLFTLDILN